MPDAHKQGGTRVVRVSVTAEDIEQGHRLDCTSCPAALAISRAIGCSALVDGFRWTFAADSDGSDCEQEWDLPFSVCAFVGDFDHGEPVEPFSFDLEVPQ